MTTATGRVMSLTMILAPNLATMTYASPHLISSSACAYTMGAPFSHSSAVLSRRTSVVTMVSDPLPARQRTPTWVSMLQTDELEAPAQPNGADESSGFLVNKDNMWRVTPSLTADLVDSEISDARL